jgi:hypothetical protein
MGLPRARGKFQRRDFRLDVLTQMSVITEDGTLFAHMGKHEVFTSIKTYSPMTVRELALALASAAVRHATYVHGIWCRDGTHRNPSNPIAI